MTSSTSTSDSSTEESAPPETAQGEDKTLGPAIVGHKKAVRKLRKRGILSRAEPISVLSSPDRAFRPLDVSVSSNMSSRPTFNAAIARALAQQPKPGFPLFLIYMNGILLCFLFFFCTDGGDTHSA